MSWWKAALGFVADVGITAACTAVCPFGGEFVGGYLGGAVNGLINGDSAGEAFTVDGGLGLLGGGVGGAIERAAAKKMEKTAAKDVASEMFGNKLFGFGNGGANRLDAWGANGLFQGSANSWALQAAKLAGRSGGRGLFGSLFSDFGSSNGRQNLGIGGMPSLTDSGSGQGSNGTDQPIGGHTDLTWFPSPNVTVTGIQDHPGATGAKSMFLIPKDYTSNAAMTAAYSQFGSTVAGAWQNAGTISSATPPVTPVAA